MRISASFAAGRLTISLHGELDHHEAGGVIKEAGELIEEYIPRECVLDMSGLTFMDSSGIAVIINIMRKMRSTGGKAYIVNPAEQPKKVISAAGIDRLITIAAGR